MEYAEKRRYSGNASQHFAPEDQRVRLDTRLRMSFSTYLPSSNRLKKTVANWVDFGNMF
jgi:hypothetical protein